MVFRRKKRKVAHHNKGKLNGSLTQWYKNGLKHSERHYKNGIEHGIRKEWNKDGKKTFQGNFVDGNEE